MPRPYRLRTEREFQTVYRSGRPRRSRLFSLWAKSNGLPHHRYGYVISSKVDKRATKRNQLKRRLRNLVPTLVPSQPPSDIVLVARPGATKLLGPDLHHELATLFSPAHAPHHSRRN